MSMHNKRLAKKDKDP